MVRFLRLIVALACTLASVFAAAPGASATGEPHLLHLTLKADTKTPYVQAQVLVTLRLKRSVGNKPIRLFSGSRLPNVKANQAIVKHLQYRDGQHLVRRNGRRYLITERRYALFPQSPGVTTLGPVIFHGRVALPGNNLSFKTARSNAITLHVRPVPHSFTGDVWLPAKSVNIYQGFNPHKSELAVSSPISRRLALTVNGAQSGELPAFKPQPGTNLQAFAFTPQRDERSTKTGLVAALKQRISLVPTKTGQVKIATIEVPWWNTVTDQEQIARFPGYTLTVTAAPAGWGAGNPSNPHAQPAGGAPSEAAAGKSLGFFRVAAGIGAIIFLALLGGLIVLGWRWRFRQSRPVPAGWTRWRLKQRALLACAANEPERAAHAILSLAASLGGQRSLGLLAAEVPEPLSAELLTLNAAIYGPYQQIWQGEGLARALRRWARRRAECKYGARANRLPPLHPLASGRHADTSVKP